MARLKKEVSEKIDAMIKAGKTPEEISKETGVAVLSIKKRLEGGTGGKRSKKDAVKLVNGIKVPDSLNEGLALIATLRSKADELEKGLDDLKKKEIKELEERLKELKRK